ncbi:hypothetical protein UY3_03745 [Chelonia mydas]|uniref:Uncharacterized protein n=1 Tax=Chelonia mydas TaxID=8469 RepID=M7BMA0_CHEMY|nr:hypothetical protein UY3_03745 [Chelonia mydas]
MLQYLQAISSEDSEEEGSAPQDLSDGGRSPSSLGSQFSGTNAEHLNVGAPAPTRHESAPRKDSARDSQHCQSSPHRSSTHGSGWHRLQSLVPHKKRRVERGRSPTPRLKQKEPATERPTSGHGSSAPLARVTATPAPARDQSSPSPQHFPISEGSEAAFHAGSFRSCQDLIAFTVPPSSLRVRARARGPTLGQRWCPQCRICLRHLIRNSTNHSARRHRPHQKTGHHEIPAPN